MVSGGEVKSLIARPVSRHFYFLKRKFVWLRLEPLFPETNLYPAGKRNPFTTR